MQFYVNTVERGTEGPFETDEIGRRLRSGELPPDALVCLKGSSDWLEPARVPALADALTPPAEEAEGPQRHRTVLEFQSPPAAASPGPQPAPAGSPRPPPPPNRYGVPAQVLPHAPPKPKKLPPPPKRGPAKPAPPPDPSIFAALGASDPAAPKPAPEESLTASIDSILEEARRAPADGVRSAGAAAADPARPVELDAGDVAPPPAAADASAAPRPRSTPARARWLQGDGRDPRKLVLVVIFGALIGLAVAVLLVALSREERADAPSPRAHAQTPSAIGTASAEPPSAVIAAPSSEGSAAARPATRPAYADQERFRRAASKANFGMTPTTYAGLEAVARLLVRAPELSDALLAQAHPGCIAPKLRALAAKPPEEQKGMLAGAASPPGDLRAPAPSDETERAARVRALQGSPIYAECVLRAGCALLRSRKVERSELVGELEADAVPVFTGLICDAEFPTLLAAELASDGGS